MIVSQFFIASLFGLASLYFLRQFFFWVYFWQLKEYRWRRIKEEISRNRKIISWPKTLAPLILFALSFIILPSFFFVLTFFYFFVQGMRSLGKALQNKWVFPKRFTKKVVLILGAVLFAWGALFWLNYFHWMQTVLLLDVLTPLGVAFIVQLVEIPARIAKKRIIRRAKEKREKLKNLTVIGISGSYGKTTVKELLTLLLSCRYGPEKVLKTAGHINTELGIAQTILRELTSSHLFFIAEIGAYHRGEIKRATELVQPKIGILTGINEQHLALFGSLENIIQGKLELVENLSSGGWAVLNGDNPHTRKASLTIPHQKFYITTHPRNEESALWAEKIKIFKDHLEFILANAQESAFVSLPLVGKAHLINVLLASFTAQRLGLSLKEIGHCFRSQNFSNLKKIRKHNGWEIIDSAYSTNPSAFFADLEHLQLWSGKKVVITPGIIELGKAASSLHREMGEKLAEAADLVIVTRGYYWKEIKIGLEKGKKKKGKEVQLFYLSRPAEIIEKVKSFAQPGDVILLEGRAVKEIIENL
jgi:UDP-N-acetylmuramoyl-tripeptide--D-alanyl-D-alanine ligase